MQMVNYLVRGEAQRGEANNPEGYSGGRPVTQQTTRTVTVPMQVIGMIAQPTEGGQLIIRTVVTNA